MGSAPRLECPNVRAAGLKSPPVPGALDGGFKLSLSRRRAQLRGTLLPGDGPETAAPLPGGQPGPSAQVGEPRQALLPPLWPQVWPLAPGQNPTVPLASAGVRPAAQQPRPEQQFSAGTDPTCSTGCCRGPQLGRLFHTQQGSTRGGLENFTQAEVRATLFSHSSLRLHQSKAHCPLGHTCGHGYQLNFPGPAGQACMPHLPEAARLGDGRDGSLVFQEKEEGCRRPGLQGPRAGIRFSDLASRRNCTWT